MICQSSKRLSKHSGVAASGVDTGRDGPCRVAQPMPPRAVEIAAGRSRDSSIALDRSDSQRIVVKSHRPDGPSSDSAPVFGPLRRRRGRGRSRGIVGDGPSFAIVIENPGE